MGVGVGQFVGVAVGWRWGGVGGEWIAAIIIIRLERCISEATMPLSSNI